MKGIARVARYLLFAAISSVLTVACPIIPCAEIFKYIDRDGAIHYTNTPTSCAFSRCESSAFDPGDLPEIFPKLQRHPRDFSRDFSPACQNCPIRLFMIRT